MGEEGLKGIDATACFSVEAWGRIEGLGWNGGGIKDEGGNGDDEGKEKKKLRLDGDNGYVGMSGR